MPEAVLNVASYAINPDVFLFLSVLCSFYELNEDNFPLNKENDRAVMLIFRELMEGQKDYVLRRRKQIEREQEEKQKFEEMKKKGFKPLQPLERKESNLIDHSTPLTATIATRKTSSADAPRTYTTQRSLSPGPSLEDYLERKLSPVKLPSLTEGRPSTDGPEKLISPRRKNSLLVPPSILPPLT